MAIACVMYDQNAPDRIQLGGNELPKALVEPQSDDLSDDEEISPEERGMLSVLSWMQSLIWSRVGENSKV